MFFLGRSGRILISIVSYVVVMALIVPHLLDGAPPRIIVLLLEPSAFLATFVTLPCFNMGTPENPVCEGSPFNLLIGLACVVIGTFFYPILSYIVLTIISGLMNMRKSTSLNIE